MSKAVRYDEYGDIEVLRVEDVERPVPGSGQVLVRVKAAGINPGEAAIRTGALAEMFPSTFPSGQGSDLAGIVEEVGDGVENFATGDEVIGFVHTRSSQAELAVVEAEHLTPKPDGVSWEEAGSLFVAGATAYAAVRAVSPGDSETVVVSGAAGGVGHLAVQLARKTGATVIGLASEPNHGWLADHGVIPVTYGEGVEDRVREASGGAVDAFIDTFGSGYVELAFDLGVRPERIETIADFEAAERYDIKNAGNMDGASAEVMAELADMISTGELDLPVAATYPLSEVRDAYRELEKRHTRGKIVLIP